MWDSRNPQDVEDSQVEVNPYQLTDMIWDLISPYFQSKYDVELTEAFPATEVTKPTIVSLITKRVPGMQNSKRHGRGHNFVKFLGTSIDGYVHELWVQTQEITIEYMVYATSTAEVKNIAWDLERAVLECVGVLQEKIEGFQLSFEQQTVDSSMLWRKQDELIKRSIRFKADLPVKIVKLVPETRTIDIIEGWSMAASSLVINRDSSSQYYDLPLADNKRVIKITHVFVKEETDPFAWTPLVVGTDYFIRTKDDNTLYLEWNDEYGKVPSMGDEFRIDYHLSHQIRGRTVTKRENL